MKKRHKQILSILTIFMVWGLLHFFFPANKTAQKPQPTPKETKKSFIMDPSRHLEEKMFKNVVSHNNTRIINLSGSNKNFFRSSEIRFKTTQPSHEELEKLEKAPIYLAYCKGASCPDELFAQFKEHKLALYDLKGGI